MIFFVLPKNEWNDNNYDDDDDGNDDDDVDDNGDEDENDENARDYFGFHVSKTPAKWPLTLRLISSSSACLLVSACCTIVAAFNFSASILYMKSGRK